MLSLQTALESLSTCTLYYHMQPPLSDVSTACSTASSFETKQSCFITEQSSSQEMTNITRNAKPGITSYAIYLRGFYTSMSQSHTSQHWTHLPQCEFVKLAMIRREKVRRGGPEEEMIRLAQQGKI